MEADDRRCTFRRQKSVNKQTSVGNMAGIGIPGRVSMIQGCHLVLIFPCNLAQLPFYGPLK